MGYEPSASYLPGRPMSSTHPGSESCRIKSKQLLRWPAEQVSGCHLGLRLAAAPKSLSGPTGNGRIFGRPGTVQSWSVHTERTIDRGTQRLLLCAEQRDGWFCLRGYGAYQHCLHEASKDDSDDAFSLFVSRSSRLPFFTNFPLSVLLEERNIINEIWDIIHAHNTKLHATQNINCTNIFDSFSFIDIH